MVLTILLAVVAIGTIVFAAIRLVPAHEQAVVFRFGRYARTHGPGLVLIVPLAEKLVAVTNRDRRTDNITTLVTTRDDVTVEVRASAQFRIFDPMLSTVSVADAQTDTVLAIEEVLRGRLQEVALRELAHPDLRLLDELAEQATGVTSAWGVTVRAIDITSTDLKVDAELLRWAEHQSGDADR